MGTICRDPLGIIGYSIDSRGQGMYVQIPGPRKDRNRVKMKDRKSH